MKSPATFKEYFLNQNPLSRSFVLVASPLADQVKCLEPGEPSQTCVDLCACLPLWLVGPPRNLLMNAEPVEPERPEPDLAAQARIWQLEEQLCEAEQELEAASEIIDE